MLVRTPAGQILAACLLASVLQPLASLLAVWLFWLKSVRKRPYCTEAVLRSCCGALVLPTYPPELCGTALCSASPKHPAARVQLRSAQASYPDARAKRCQSSNHALPQQLVERLVHE